MKSCQRVVHDAGVDLEEIISVIEVWVVNSCTCIEDTDIEGIASTLDAARRIIADADETLVCDIVWQRQESDYVSWLSPRTGREYGVTLYGVAE